MNAVRSKIDAWRLPVEQNNALIGQVVDLCHRLGIDLQGELRRIGGTNDDLTANEWVAALARPAASTWNGPNFTGTG